MKWETVAALGVLALNTFILFSSIVNRLLKGQYATRAYVDALVRPLKDAQMLETSARKDLETELKVLKSALEHMPTIEHIDELKERVHELSRSQAVQHTENKTKLDNIIQELRRR